MILRLWFGYSQNMANIARIVGIWPLTKCFFFLCDEDQVGLRGTEPPSAPESLSPFSPFRLHYNVI